MLERLDGLMALEQSRGQAKEEARVAHKKTWAFTTGKIHSYKTRQTYQEHAINFVKWARDAYGFKRLELIDERVQELTAEFLQQYLDAGKSASTLLTVRSALRMAFADRTLMQDVPLPERSQSKITRSRGEKAHDKHFNPDHWPEHVHFEQAAGLRRDEMKLLRAADLWERETDPASEYYGQPVVKVWNGKGGKARTVPVLAGREQDVLSLKEGLAAEDLVFPRIPKHMDIHSYRREYAQALYLQYAPGFSLPPSQGRLKRGSYHRDAALAVTRALGHNRIEVVLSHYIR
jgi:hypothetical protein